MKSKIGFLIKLSGIVTVAIFSLLYYFKEHKSIFDYWSLVLEAAGYSVIICVIYEKYLWRYAPFVNFPKLKKEYKGVLKYNYNNKVGEKLIKIEIKQTFLSIRVKSKTNEVVSKTLISELIEENEEFVLYYTYITTPVSEFSDRNPIQIGTCKLIIDDINNIRGSYWTNRKTIGDLYFQ